MALIDRIIAQEAGSDTRLREIVTSLVADGAISEWCAIGIVRSIRFVVDTGENPDVQRRVGGVYLRELETLI